jgi:hypothetical protein
MAKQIIVLTQQTSESVVNYNVLFWFPVTSGIRTQTAGSSWVANGTSAGASAAENTAIQNGTVLEEPHSFAFPVSTPVATIEATLQQAWANRNVQVNAIGQNKFYGFFWDGTTWSNS